MPRDHPLRGIRLSFAMRLYARAPCSLQNTFRLSHELTQQGQALNWWRQATAPNPSCLTLNKKGPIMHQPMKQLPERAISEEEAREILRDAEYCVVATVDEDGHPYATPLSYALDKDALLIHTGAAGGQKTEDWERDPRVCVTVAMDMEPVFVEENGEPGFFTTRFASVIATGTVRRVTEMAEVRRALALLCLKYAPEYKDEIGGAIDRELPVTAVWAIDLNHISGKAGRRVPNGKGAVSHR